MYAVVGDKTRHKVNDLLKPSQKVLGLIPTVGYVHDVSLKPIHPGNPAVICKPQCSQENIYLCEHFHTISSHTNTYREEAVEVGEVEGVCNLRQDVQGQLSLIGRLAALVGRAPQGRDMAGVQGLHQELREREREREREKERQSEHHKLW